MLGIEYIYVTVWLDAIYVATGSQAFGTRVVDRSSLVQPANYSQSVQAQTTNRVAGIMSTSSIVSKFESQSVREAQTCYPQLLLRRDSGSVGRRQRWETFA